MITPGFLQKATRRRVAMATQMTRTIMEEDRLPYNFWEDVCHEQHRNFIL